MEENCVCPSEENADKEKLPIKCIFKTPIENIKCLHCGKMFSRHSNLILHTFRVHKTIINLSEKGSKCTYTTANKNHMKRHVQDHVNLNQTPKEKATLCLHCGKTFSKHSNLNRHTIRVHKTTITGAPISDKYTETNKFLCPSCGKQFFWKHGLERHIKAVHFNLSEKCSKCTYTTAYKNHMEMHVQVHINHNQTPKENATLCFHCGKTFSNQSNLTKHTIRIHKTNITGTPIPDKDTETKKFLCILCDKQFLWKRGLQRHIKAVHVTRNPDEFNDAGSESSLVDYEQTTDELQEPVLHEISKQISENHHQHLNAKKKLMIEDFQKWVTTKVSTSDQLDIINKMLKQPAVMLDDMNGASA